MVVETESKALHSGWKYIRSEKETLDLGLQVRTGLQHADMDEQRVSRFCCRKEAR